MKDAEVIPEWKKKFYTSKEWKYVRALVVQRENGVCQHCGNDIFKAAVGHHTTELTSENYKYPAVSLNPDLIMLLHQECHNIVHEKLKQKKETIVNLDLSIDYTRR